MSDDFLENASPTVYSTRIPQRSYAVTALDADAWEPAPPAGSVSTMSAAQLAAGFGGGAAESSRGGAPLGRWTRDPIDALEVFEHIRHLNDPEHPLSLEQLNVASLDLIAVDDLASTIDVRFTPTIPHCAFAGGALARARRASHSPFFARLLPSQARWPRSLACASA